MNLPSHISSKEYSLKLNAKSVKLQKHVLCLMLPCLTVCLLTIVITSVHDTTKTAGSLVYSGESLWRLGTWVHKLITSLTNYVTLGIFLISLTLISKKRKITLFRQCQYEN